MTSNQAFRFYIISGNLRRSFDIKQGGQVYVARPLDRERIPQFDLIVAVTDGVFVSTAHVHIEILDVNGEYHLHTFLHQEKELGNL